MSGTDTGSDDGLDDGPDGRGRLAAVAAGGLLVLVGLGLVVFFATSQRSAPAVALVTSEQAAREPAPASASAPSPTKAPAPAAPSPSPSPRPTAGTVAEPVSVRIPSIGVRSVVERTGVDDAGGIKAPARGPAYDRAAWFTGSPRPGQAGPSVLVGHVDGHGGQPSVFFDLASLERGAKVHLTRADDSTVAFEVYRVERYAKDDFPTATVYGNTAGPELRLITCGGEFDTAVGHYRDNTVVYARALPPG